MTVSDATKETPPAIPTSEWKWFGHAAHFICGRWCRFHLATLIGEYMISTVGEYVHPRHSDGSEKAEENWLAQHPKGEEIGCDRFYETAVFRVTGKKCDDPECGCGMPEIEGSELDFSGYQTAGDAAKGHLEMCRKWSVISSWPHKQPQKDL